MKLFTLFQQQQEREKREIFVSSYEDAFVVAVF